MSLIRGFYEPELVHAHLVFSCLESLKTPKKTLGGVPFSSNLVSWSWKSVKHNIEELNFRRRKGEFFSHLVNEVRKMLNYHLPNAPSREAYSLSFTSVKESKITRKDRFEYEEWGLQQ